MSRGRAPPGFSAAGAGAGLAVLRSVLGRALLVWFGILLLAILNGAFRQGVLVPRLGDASAHVVSTVSLCALILATTWLAMPWLRPATTWRAWQIGLLWVVMTVAFEFLAGHYLFGRSWEYLLADYQIARGRIWVLVLIVTAVAPRVTLPHR